MKNIILSIRNLLFDNSCVCCGGKSSDKFLYLCYDCLNILIKSKSLNKVNNTYFLWTYSETLRKLILKYKSHSVLALGSIISSLIEEEFFTVMFEEDIDYVIPIPISYKRQQERGFNQVEEILKNLNYSYLTGKRIKNTKKMCKIYDKNKREKNIKDSFYFGKDLSGKNILIFDDIITTGATIREFVEELEKKGKFNKIVVFSLSVGKTYLRPDKRMC